MRVPIHLTRLFLTRVSPHSPRLWLLRLRLRLICLEYVTTKRRESDLSHALFTLPNNLNGNSFGSTGYRIPPFNQSLLSTAIDNIKEDSLLFSTSSLATLSKVAVKIKSVWYQ